MEYLDERFHVAADAGLSGGPWKAKSLHAAYRKDWYSLMNTIQTGTASQADTARVNGCVKLRRPLRGLLRSPTSERQSLAWWTAIPGSRCCQACAGSWHVELVWCWRERASGYMTRVFEARLLPSLAVKPAGVKCASVPGLNDGCITADASSPVPAAGVL